MTKSNANIASFFPVNNWYHQDVPYILAYTEYTQVGNDKRYPTLLDNITRHSLCPDVIIIRTH